MKLRTVIERVSTCTQSIMRRHPTRVSAAEFGVDLCCGLQVEHQHARFTPPVLK